MGSEQLNKIESMKIKLRTLLGRSNTVGVIASEADLRVALRNPTIADMFEWRVDCFLSPVAEKGINRLHKLGRPIILTIRVPSEGGKERGWSNAGRAHWYHQYLHLATLIDIEASTVTDPALMDVVQTAKREGVGVIISQHILTIDWKPKLAFDAAVICHDLYGDIFKVVLHPDGFDDVCSFMGCLPELDKIIDGRVAPMLIGDKFGKVSRLLFGLNASPLIYGCLSRAVVKGQWKVSEIRPMMEKMQ